jgi:hypothetical protein
MNIYHEAAMKKNQVLLVAEVQRGRENLSDAERPGRPTAGLP